MIDANEFYVVERLKELEIDPEKIRRFIETFEGWRIYFRKKQNEYERIREVYRQMRAQGVSRADVVRKLSEIFEKSESRIRYITAEQGSIFEL